MSRWTIIKPMYTIDFSKPINEEEWHEICKTPLRSSDILCVIIRNIFPQAKNIKRYSNCVVFDLLDFSISIPTSNCRGISISTKWYIPDKDIPKLELEHYDNILRLKKYFELVDTKSVWYKFVHYICLNRICVNCIFSIVYEN